MNDRPDHLRIVHPRRAVPPSRFGEVIEKKNAERALRLDAERRLALAVAGQARLLAALERIVRHLPNDTQERLNGVGIGDAAEMNDVQLGGLLVRIDGIMGGG